MYKQIKVSIYINLINFISAAYLEVESNYVKPKLERNNIVNKGLWVRNNKDRKYASDFIFRANSLDVDNVLQNNYDAFGENNVANSAFFSGFNMERIKRSTNEKAKQRFTKKVKCVDKSNCPNVGVESKLVSTLKPVSVYNDHPHEISVLLNSLKKGGLTEQAVTKSINNIDSENFSNIKEYNLTYTIFPNESKNKSYSSIIPKRSMYPHDYESELIKKIEITEDFNITDDNVKKIDKNNIFDKEDMNWHNAPTSNINVYKIAPRVDDVKNKPINERGLLKVLSMLTKTFKKVMKQHQDIKRIHNKLYNLNDDFTKNSELMTSKFEDFNTKYLFMTNLNKELKRLEAKLEEKEQRCELREKEISENLKEFENQQVKFLTQQRQFYNVQKLMLTQNEKINLKQNVIAKTQSEISQRQNNFARILKKAKQVYIESKNTSPTKLNMAIAKPKTKPAEKKVQSVKVAIAIAAPTATTLPPSTTESVKINLFSIPTLTRLENQDQMILDEKDYQPVDELIYKYYFNNTFIDDLMKNKILATFLAASESTDSNLIKNKRNEKATANNTHLIPDHNTIKMNKKHRNRRWIKHSKKTNKNIDFKGPPTPVNRVPDIEENVVYSDINTDHLIKDITKKGDPFVTMALSFCKEVGQNANLQLLNWCVEKALRRLKVIDLKISPLMKAGPPATQNSTPPQISKNKSTSPQTSPTPVLQKQNVQLPATTEDINAVMYFPDNDELENKLKEYDLKPDTEGTVYYDGSLHASDIARIGDADSGGFSDIMPGPESNSRMQLDPMTFDIQSQRRADVRKINERRMKMGKD